MAYNTSLYGPPIIGGPGAKGDAGSDAAVVDVEWHLGHVFGAGDRCYHSYTGRGQSVFRCKTGQGHTAEAANEPTIGANWEDKWEPFALGGADGAGSGDVVGPASSVADHDVGFADTTGKLLKNMGAFATRLQAAIAAFTASTTATDGDVDKIPVLEAGGQKLKTVDSILKRYTLLQIVPGAWAPATTNGGGSPTKEEQTTNKHNLYMFSFGNSAKTYECATVDLPFGYDGGAIHAYVVWRSTGTTTKNVVFGIQLASVGDNESMDPSYGTAVEVIDTCTGAAKKRLQTPIFSSITPSGTPAGGETLYVRLYRDPGNGSDDLDELVEIINVKLLIPMNKLSEV